MESRVGANDYRVEMGSKTKTYHMNTLKKYIAGEPEVDSSGSFVELGVIQFINSIWSYYLETNFGKL